MWTITVIAVGAGCLAIGYYFGKQRVLLAKGVSHLTEAGREASSGKSLEVERLADVHEDFKMVKQLGTIIEEGEEANVELLFKNGGPEISNRGR